MSGCALTLPVNATSNPGVGDQSGYRKGYRDTWGCTLFFYQEASIQRAAKNGGITRISTVDIKTSNALENYQINLGKQPV